MTIPRMTMPSTRQTPARKPSVRRHHARKPDARPTTRFNTYHWVHPHQECKHEQHQQDQPAQDSIPQLPNLHTSTIHVPHPSRNRYSTQIQYTPHLSTLHWRTIYRLDRPFLGMPKSNHRRPRHWWTPRFKKPTEQDVVDEKDQVRTAREEQRAWALVRKPGVVYHRLKRLGVREEEAVEMEAVSEAMDRVLAGAHRRDVEIDEADGGGKDGEGKSGRSGHSESVWRDSAREWGIVVRNLDEEREGHLKRYQTAMDDFLERANMARSTSSGLSSSSSALEGSSSRSILTRDRPRNLVSNPVPDSRAEYPTPKMVMSPAVSRLSRTKRSSAASVKTDPTTIGLNSVLKKTDEDIFNLDELDLIQKRKRGALEGKEQSQDRKRIRNGKSIQFNPSLSVMYFCRFDPPIKASTLTTLPALEQDRQCLSSRQPTEPSNHPLTKDKNLQESTGKGALEIHPGDGKSGSRGRGVRSGRNPKDESRKRKRIHRLPKRKSFNRLDQEQLDLDFITISKTLSDTQVSREKALVGLLRSGYFGGPPRGDLWTA